VPCSTGAFSFDIVSPISSLGSDDSGSKTTLVAPSFQAQEVSNNTPKLESPIQKVRESVEEEMREEAESKVTVDEESNDDASKTTPSSTASRRTPLRLLSYLEVESINATLTSFPFDEISETMDSNARLNSSDSNEQTGDEMSPKSAYSLSSILDRDSFYDEKMKPDSNDEAERKAADLAYVGCEIDPTEFEGIDPCDGNECEIQRTTNNSPKNESVTLLREKSMNGSHDEYTALVGERDWIDQLTDCLMCEKSVPIKLSGSQHDLNLTLSHFPSNKAVKKSMEGSNAVTDSYSTKCHSIDLTPPEDWDNTGKDELRQGLSDEEQWIDQLTTCGSPSNKRTVAVQEQNWLEQSLDQVTEFATCGMLK
jgi:hypothetical protein